MPISEKELRKLFYDAGYEIVPGGGKGSHWKLYTSELKNWHLCCVKAPGLKSKKTGQY